MATKNDTSKSRSGRNRPTAKAKSASRPTPHALENAIEEERARLMQAHSILNCVAIAMDAEDISPGDGPHYPTLIERACDLIDETIGRLDAIQLDRLMKAPKAEANDEDDDEFEAGLSLGRGKDSVREGPSPVYGYNPVVPGPEVQEPVLQMS
jgi:hypothetical protein